MARVEEWTIDRSGRSGLLVSSVGLGCNNFGGRIDADASKHVVHAALEAGITLFDTADIYGGERRSEEILGELLAGHRDEVVLATKFGYQPMDMPYGAAAGAKGSRAYVRRAVEASLRRLRTDHIDLYQFHSPDPVTPIGETVRGLHELVLEGKVRYVGHSNFSGWQLAEAAHVARELGASPFVTAQNKWSLLDRDVERELVPAALRLGRSILDLAVGALLAQPVIGSVITGATRPEQVSANALAGSWRPTPDELAQVDAVVPPPTSA